MINKDLSDIELAKRLKEIKGITLSDNEFDKILKSLIPEDRVDEVHRIIRSLSQEDEFALICKMMECCSSITPLDQTPILNTDEKTPDFQVTFHPASFFSNMPSHSDFYYKCMVEVKSTDKLRFKTSRSDIIKRKNYAERFNLPLLYAVRFLIAESHAYWIIVTADSLIEKNTLTTNDYVPSLNSVIFNNYTLIVNNQYSIIRRYSNKCDGVGEIHKSLGALQGISIHDVKGIRYELEPADALLFSMLFGIFKTYGTYVETFQDESTVYSHFSSHQIYTLLDIVYGISNILANNDGNKTYDPTRAIANIDSPSNPTILMQRSLLENLVSKINMNCQNFFFFGMLGTKAQHQAKVGALFPNGGIA